MFSQLGCGGVWGVSWFTREVQQYVVGMVDQQGRNVGCPSELEARKYLVHTDGNVMTASHKVYAFRKKKVRGIYSKPCFILSAHSLPMSRGHIISSTARLRSSSASSSRTLSWSGTLQSRRYQHLT